MAKARRKKHLIVGILLATFAMLLGAGILSGLADFDLSEHEMRELAFETKSGRLVGTLVLPEDANTSPIALIVHGDGPQDRFAGEGYLPFISALLDADIGVYSWDKPGIGASNGDWLQQSMGDRADEAEAALRAVMAEMKGAAGPVGFLGFSQAGWVLPTLAAGSAPPAFTVIVGGAINWRRQGDYFTMKRLEADGMSLDERTRFAERQQRANDALFSSNDPSYQAYLDQTGDTAPMSEARYDFARRNYRSDATADLERAMGPFLVVLGEADLNVDADGEAAIFRRALAGRHPNNRVVLLSDATHGLLRAFLFNYQLASDWPSWLRLAFAVLGRHAYVPGALDLITDWITEVSLRTDARAELRPLHWNARPLP